MTNIKNEITESERWWLNELIYNREIIRDVDGFFYYSQLRTDFFLTSHSLRLIADELDRLNEPTEKILGELNLPELPLTINEFCVE